MRAPNFHAVAARLTPAWFRRRARDAILIDGGGACVFCGAKLRSSKYGICSGCNSRPRIRSIPIILSEVVASNLKPDVAAMPCLAFSAVKRERELLGQVFSHIESVSLFGKYGHSHQTGIDARDLGRVGDGIYAGHYSCLLLDYFSDHERALSEAHRVIAPGGVFLTHIQDTRLTETRRSPRVISAIRPRPGYYEYIPADQGMHDVMVGALWFLDAMSRLGMTALRYRVVDGGGIPCDWFVGWKP